jgi:hypothetical protein
VVPTKAQKAYGYIEPIKIDILKLRICDKETMKRKKIHAADDPRLISSTIAPTPDPPTPTGVTAQVSHCEDIGTFLFISCHI